MPPDIITFDCYDADKRSYGFHLSNKGARSEFIERTIKAVGDEFSVSP